MNYGFSLRVMMTGSPSGKPRLNKEKKKKVLKIMNHLIFCLDERGNKLIKFTALVPN